MIGSTRYIAAAEIARQTTLSGEISKLQQSISSNQRLTAPSDDAPAAARIAEIRQTQADHAVWTKNVGTGTAIASAADAVLGSMTNLLQRAKELMLSGSNQTNNAVDRASYAQELRGLADDLDSYARTADPNGNPLFPAGSPTAIPLSEGLNVAATATKAQIFDGIATRTGPKSLAGILRDAAGALTAGDKVAAIDIDGNPILDVDGLPVMITRAEAITANIADVDTALAHVGAERTDQGIRAQRFDDAKARLAASDTDLAVERSALGDTDLTYAVTTFQAKQLALQAAQTVYAQAHKSSLFDMLG